jgi:Ca2+:H+ antiporter
MAVLITGQIASDGESNWLEGALLLAVYVILAISFYFMPEAPAHAFIPSSGSAVLVAGS